MLLINIFNMQYLEVAEIPQIPSSNVEPTFLEENLYLAAKVEAACQVW